MMVSALRISLYCQKDNNNNGDTDINNNGNTDTYKSIGGLSRFGYERVN